MAGVKIVDKDKCTGCGGCVSVCAQGAIKMTADREGFLYPAIDMSKCVECELCTKVCPQITKNERFCAVSCWGARAKEKSVHMLGSSGGVFPLMAECVIEQGGVVFGASLSENGSIQHIGIDRKDDIPLIAKTKYVQSNLSGIWDRMAEVLRVGETVLFCGTPCQADAVRSRFGKGDGKLVIVDLICYGVPSPGIWAKYVEYLEKKHGDKFHSFSFRDKRNQDNGHTAAFVIGVSEYVYRLGQDKFCRSFMSNVNIRPSCFDCQYCTVKRSSDMTIGDFWGIEKIYPQFDDGMGVSAIICRTDTGEKVWKQIKDRTEYFACAENDIANVSQPRLSEPTKPAATRPLYMWLYNKIPFSIWIKLF